MKDVPTLDGGQDIWLCWCWSGVREKHCWLAGGWMLLLK